MTYDENLLKSTLINLVKILDSGRVTEDIQKDPTMRVAKRLVANMKVNGNLEPIRDSIELKAGEMVILERLFSFSAGTDIFSIIDPDVISLRTLDFVVAGNVETVTKWGDGKESRTQVPKIPLKITDKGISWLNAYRAKLFADTVAEN